MHLSEYLYGVLDLDFWGYVIITFLMVQLAMMSVTLYLHRDQAHRAVNLHPALKHLFRLWIWMTSGMGTRPGSGSRCIASTMRAASGRVIPIAPGCSA